MKTLIACFVCLSIHVTGQTEPPHEKLIKHSSFARDRALKIQHGVSRTKKEHWANSEMIGLHIDSAITEHQNLKKEIRRSKRDEAERHHMAIDKLHTEAKKHHGFMTAELMKERHNEYVVRHHATHIYTSLEKAEKEQEILKVRTSK